MPLAPICLAHLAGVSTGGDTTRVRGNILGNAFAYVLGFSLVFIAAGVARGAAGGLVSTTSIVAGHHGLLVPVGGVLLIALGLHRLGVVRLPLLDQTGFAAVIFTYYGNFVFGGLHAHGGVQ